MTKATAKEATKSVVVPTAVVLAGIAAWAQFGGTNENDRRILALETRYVELERQSREKWDLTMEKLTIIQSQLSRLEGKMDR